jgi:hypothetical protein
VLIAAALAARQSSNAIVAIVNEIPANQGLALLPATCPLFPLPAELAVGLALKEMRYGLFRPIRPWNLQRFLRFLRSHPPVRLGLGTYWRGSIDTGAATYVDAAWRLSCRGRWALPAAFL